MVNEDPVVIVSITNSLSTRIVAGKQLVGMSNIDMIELEVNVTSADKKIAENFAQGHHFTFEAFRVDGDIEPRAKVAVQLRDEHYAIRRGKPVGGFSLLFPGDEKIRQAKIEKYLDEILQSGRETNRVGEHFVKGILLNKSIFIHDFEKTFTENEMGMYELYVNYQNTNSKYWQGAARSKPVFIEIIKKGDYFDTLKTDAEKR